MAKMIRKTLTYTWKITLPPHLLAFLISFVFLFNLCLLWPEPIWSLGHVMVHSGHFTFTSLAQNKALPCFFIAMLLSPGAWWQSLSVSLQIPCHRGSVTPADTCAFVLSRAPRVPPPTMNAQVPVPVAMSNHSQLFYLTRQCGSDNRRKRCFNHHLFTVLACCISDRPVAVKWCIVFNSSY